MALSKYEIWSNGIKTAFFSKNSQKIAKRLGASPPDLAASDGCGLGPQTLVCDAFELH